MGEVGTGTVSLWNLNYNPAFLPFNTFTIYQVGIEMDRRNISSNAVDGKKVAGGLKSLNLAFPVIIGKWTTAISVSPYSTSNYASYSTTELTSDVTATTRYNGSGGVSSIAWANGVKLGKGFYAGLKYNVMFGSVQNKESTIVSTSILDEIFSSYETSLVENSSYSGSKLDLSLGYRKTVGTSNDRIINLGIIYERSSELTGLRDQWEETNAVEERFIFENIEANLQTPSVWSIGGSYQFRNKFSIGSDVVRMNWSNDQLTNDNLRNTTKISFGGEYTPDIASVNNYWRRITYRAGVNFGPIPYTINGRTINEFGINFGGSVPFGYSKLDLAFKYGQLGTLNNDLVRETYFRIVIGASINDRWFIKRRYD